MPKALSSAALLNTRLTAIHDEVRIYFPFVARIAVALYDADTDQIKTFICSPYQTAPLRNYSAKLSDATWLDALRRSRMTRIIDRLDQTNLGPQEHSQKIHAADYKSSYTIPMYDGDRFRGFVFFDADRCEAFTPTVTRHLDLFVRIISLMVENSVRATATLAGSVHLLREISRFRDDETAAHLSRIAYYAELIAREIAKTDAVDDEWVDKIRLFAPLHDIGKVATPDAILFKPEGLTDEELAVMRQHPLRGETLLSGLIDKLALAGTPYIDDLLRIARHYHENWDGSGYPDGLAGEGIPMAARLVRVADVFDALCSKRYYKAPWPVADAVGFLRERRGTLFDPRCVDILIDRLPQVLDIMGRFQGEVGDPA